jgi:hypothetical protein
MDDPALAEADHLRALVALGRINTLSLTTARLAAGVVALADGQEERGAGLEVIDVASGGGDVTIDLARGPSSAPATSPPASAARRRSCSATSRRRAAPPVTWP